MRGDRPQGRPEQRTPSAAHPRSAPARTSARFRAGLLVLLTALVLLPPVVGQGDGDVAPDDQADLLLRYRSQVTFTVWGNGTTYNEFLVEARPGDALNATVLVKVRGRDNSLADPRNFTVRMELDADEALPPLAVQNGTIAPYETNDIVMHLNGTLPESLEPGRYALRFHLDTGPWDPEHGRNDPNPVPLQVGAPVASAAADLSLFQRIIGPLVFTGLLVAPFVYRRVSVTGPFVSMRQGFVRRWEEGTAGWLHLEPADRARRARWTAVAVFVVGGVLSLVAAGGLAVDLVGLVDAFWIALIAGVVHLIGGTQGRRHAETQRLVETGLDPHEHHSPLGRHIKDTVAAATQTLILVFLLGLIWQQLAAATDFFRWPRLAALDGFLVIGIAIGAVYSLIAIGYTMVYGILKFINFAHGEVFMWGAYFAWILAVDGLLFLGVVSFPIAVLLSIILTAGLGAAIERIAYRPLRGHSRLAPLVTAIALSLLLQATAQFFFGASKVTYTAQRSTFTGSALHRWFDQSFHLFGTVVDALAVTILGVSIALMVALHLFIKYSKLGRAMRATADDLETARTIGINVDRVISATFVIGSALAAVGGIAFALEFGLEPTMGIFPGIKAFTAAVVGGIGNIYGAFLGGFLIGVAENVGGQFIDSRFQKAITFGILILFLLLRPQGILGTKGGDDRR